ncbi:hypothetical protein [Actinokineospora pegani]|uniref:hypothetical protein n=1 Tax=Actinokineospora pegani TaxID=2654637 RepID=UPI0038B26B19
MRPRSPLARLQIVEHRRLGLGDLLLGEPGLLGQRGGPRVVDLAGADALERRVQLAVDRGRLRQDGLHLDPQGHDVEEARALLGLHHLAVDDPQAVPDGLVLGRLDPERRLPDGLLGVVDDLHRRGQPCGELLQALAPGAQVVVGGLRRLPRPPRGLAAVELVLQADNEVALRHQVVADLSHGVGPPLLDLVPRGHQRPPVRPKPSVAASSCAW